MAAHPPRSYDLGQAGDRLASFLQQDPLIERLPFLPDLARLEWAVAEAFVATNAQPLRWEELAGLDPAEVASLPLRTIPGTAVVRSEWPLLDIWRLRDVPDEEVDLDVTGRPSTVPCVGGISLPNPAAVQNGPPLFNLPPGARKSAK